MSLPSKSDLEELREHAGDDEHKKGSAILRKGGVRQTMLFENSARGIVTETGGASYTAYVHWAAGMETDCSCDDAKPCRHAIALALQVAKHPESCLDADWIEAGVQALAEEEAKRLLNRSLQLDPALWNRLNAPIVDKEGGMKSRVSSAWVEGDAAGAVWKLQRLLEDARQWNLPEGGRARMDLVLEMASSVLEACERGVKDASSESAELLQDCSYTLCEEMERVGDAAAYDGLSKAVGLLQRDSHGLGMYGMVLPFSLALGAKSLLAVVWPLIELGRVPVAQGGGEEWAAAFKEAALRLAASTWPGGDRLEAVDSAEMQLTTLASSGLPRREDVEAAEEAVAVLPTWKIAPHLATMRQDRHSRTRWFRVLCSRDAGLAISFLQQGPADLEVDMVISLMLSLPKESAATLGAEWAEMRLGSDATKVTEIAQVLAHVHSLLMKEEWSELRAMMMARAADAEKVDAALSAAEESRV
jgi:hypothetical protein